MTERRRVLNLPNLAVGVAIGALLMSGTAYAAVQITSAQIKNNTIKSVDVKDGKLTGTDVKDGSLSAADLAAGVLSSGVPDNSVTSAKIVDGAVTSADILNGTVASADVTDNSLTADDLATSSVGQAEIATDGVAATEIQNDSIDAGEIVDFGLSNQDIGVLFAQVDAGAGLDNSSGGVVVTRVGAVGGGNYEVDFGRNITACAFFATIGPSGAGSAQGEINVADRSGNVEAVFVDTNDNAGAAADRPFHLLVVC